MADREGLRPLYSTHAEDPAWTRAIDAFVVSLAERIDELQDADSGGAFERAGVLAAELAREAREVGYAELAGCAGQVEGAARSDKADDVHAGVVELTDLALRIRLGHRGAL